MKSDILAYLKVFGINLYHMFVHSFSSIYMFQGRGENKRVQIKPFPSTEAKQLLSVSKQ